LGLAPGIVGSLSNVYSLDSIAIEGIVLDVYLGAFAEERRIAQPVHVELQAAVEMSGARRHDRLAQTLDYASVYQQFEKIAQSKPFALLEHLGQALLAAVIEHPLVLNAAITLRKPKILKGATPSVTVNGRRTTRVAIGLGANVGDAQATLSAAVAGLDRIGSVTAVSSLYRTAPWGRTDQPDFLNAAALIQTTLLPRTILAALKGLERELGRVPGPRWGPRALDLDVLDDENALVDEAELTVPHPRLFERAFALVPLAQIAPEYTHECAALSQEQRAGVIAVAEWPTWCANRDAS
jgi:dihydroneopterin aldolase/2-amino-4-hydroxy-6-hydroxymethyldihydropteridine diphosphokinase